MADTVNVVQYNLTPEEQDECNAIAREGKELAEKWRALTSITPRGMLVFIAALDCVERLYPAVFNFVAENQAPNIIVQWVAAEKPDTLGQIPARLKKRYSKR